MNLRNHGVVFRHTREEKWPSLLTINDSYKFSGCIGLDEEKATAKP
jgi:hypothetical protein